MLIELTKQLLQYNEQSYQIFAEETKKTDFKKDIVPFVEQVDSVVKRWSVLAEDWVKDEHPKHIHLMQIEQVCENVKVNTVECFGTAKPKRFKERYKAIDYVLRSIMEHGDM